MTQAKASARERSEEGPAAARTDDHVGAIQYKTHRKHRSADKLYIIMPTMVAL